MICDSSHSYRSSANSVGLHESARRKGNSAQNIGRPGRHRCWHKAMKLSAWLPYQLPAGPEIRNFHYGQLIPSVPFPSPHPSLSFPILPFMASGTTDARRWVLVHFRRNNQHSLTPGFMRGNFEIFDLKCKNSTSSHQKLMGIIFGIRQRRKNFLYCKCKDMRFKGKINTLCWT
jgi:hypothetical protein